MATDPEFSMRRYRSSDNAAIKELHVRSFRSAGVPESRLNMAADDLDNIEEVYFKGGEFLVGEVDGRVIAMCGFKKVSSDVAELMRMRVDPDFQQHGYAQALLTVLEDEARGMGYRKMMLYTSSRFIAAQQLYIKNGYKEVRRDSAGKFVDVYRIEYEKKL